MHIVALAVIYFTPIYFLLQNKLGIILQVIPPPNVTGALHIGHALATTIEVY